METGSIPIRYLCMSRRVLYFHHIINLKDEELVKRILTEQRNNPSPGDVYPMVMQDLKLLNIPTDEQILVQFSKRRFKTLVNRQIVSASFNFLKNL